MAHRAKCAWSFSADDGAACQADAGGRYQLDQPKGLRDGIDCRRQRNLPDPRAFPVTDYMLARPGRCGGSLVRTGHAYPALRFDALQADAGEGSAAATFAASGQDGSRVSPKVGAVIKLSDGVRLFANNCAGLQAPEPSQVNNFFASRRSAIPASSPANLKPENGESFEGGLRYFNHAGLVRPDRLCPLSRLHRPGGDHRPALPSPANPWIYQWRNLGGVKIRGIEARAEEFSPDGAGG